MDILKLHNWEDELQMSGYMGPGSETFDDGADLGEAKDEREALNNNGYGNDDPNPGPKKPRETQEQREAREASEKAREAGEEATIARGDVKVAKDELQSAQSALEAARQAEKEMIKEINIGAQPAYGGQYTLDDLKEQTALAEIAVAQAESDLTDAQSIASSAQDNAATLAQEALHTIVQVPEPDRVGHIDLTNSSTAQSSNPSGEMTGGTAGLGGWMDAVRDFFDPTRPHDPVDFTTGYGDGGIVSGVSVSQVVLATNPTNFTSGDLYAVQIMEASDNAGIVFDVNELYGNAETLFDPSTGGMGPGGAAFFTALSSHQDPGAVVEMSTSEFTAYIEEIRTETALEVENGNASPRMGVIINEYTDRMTEAHGYFADLESKIELSGQLNALQAVVDQVNEVEPYAYTPTNYQPTAEQEAGFDRMSGYQHVAKFYETTSDYLEAHGYEVDSYGKVVQEPSEGYLNRMGIEERELYESMKALNEGRWSGDVSTLDEAVAMEQRVLTASEAYARTHSLDPNDYVNPHPDEHILSADGDFESYAEYMAGNQQTEIGAAYARLARSDQAVTDGDITDFDLEERRNALHDVANLERQYPSPDAVKAGAIEHLETELENVKNQIANRDFNNSHTFVMESSGSGVETVVNAFNEHGGIIDAANDAIFQVDADMEIEGPENLQAVRAFTDHSGRAFDVARDASVVANPPKPDVGAPANEHDFNSSSLG